MKPSIAIVDDDPDLREDMAEAIEESALAERGAWVFVTAAPLEHAGDYPAWIRHQNIAALILDWRLNEQGNEEAVGYTAAEIIQAIRSSIPDFPIFVCSSYSEDAQPYLPQVEFISSRSTFAQKPEDFLPRITRSAQRYHDAHQLVLAEISILAKKVATNDASPAEQGRLYALRESLGLSFQLMSPSRLSVELAEAEKLQNEMSRVLERLNERIKKDVEDAP